MSYGLQLSASGAAAALYRLDVFSNNLANMDTPGFKADVPRSAPRAPAREEDGLLSLPSNALLERLGAGTALAPNMISLQQGATRTTGNDLDVAIEGRGFFTVQAGPGPEGLRLTRDGRFTQNAQGQLVMAGTGLPVLDVKGQPINLNGEGKVVIDRDGTITQDGATIAQLQLIDAPAGALRKDGHSLFAAQASVFDRKTLAPGSVRQHALEESSVDEIQALMQVTSAGREVEANVDMMRMHDRLVERAIMSLGRLA